MGDIAEMMLDGTLCEGCGEYLGDGDGYPQYCPTCQGDGRGYEDALNLPGSTKTTCPTCGKRVKKAGLADHRRDVHTKAKEGSKS